MLGFFCLCGVLHFWWAFLFLFQIKTVPRSRFASGTTESVKKFKIDFLSEAFFLDSHGELSTAAVVV
jgi:hypothetical protein